MYRLESIGLINWYLLDIEDVTVDGDTGVIGENRSGKSSLLDLVQTVMTGNDHRYLRLNASANPEGKRKNARSVRDYCLGRVGGKDEAPKRDDAITHLVLAFRHSVTQHPISIGLSLEARIDDRREETVGRFVAPGLYLKAGDFVDETSGEPMARTWSAMVPRLEAACRDAGSKLSIYTSAEHFVGDYLKATSPTGRMPNVKQYLKALANAVSFETIESETEFVRAYILEDKPVQIGQLRTAIRTYREIDRTIREMREQLADLKLVREDVESHRAALDDMHLNEWIAARAGFDAAWSATSDARRRRDDCQRRMASLQLAIKENENETETLREELRNVDRMIAQSRGESRLALIDGEIAKATAARDRALQPIDAYYKAVVLGTACLAEADKMPDRFGAVVAGLREIRLASGRDQPPTWPRKPAVIQDLVASLAQLPQLRRHLVEEADRVTMDAGPVAERVKGLAGTLANLRERGSAISPEAAYLYVDLDKAGMGPKLLCTLVEVEDEEWREAAESLLGRDREAIIVPPHHATAAINHLRHNHLKYRGCRIANTRKLDPGDVAISAESLAAVLKTSDPLAAAFLKRRIGNVRRADAVDDLHRPGRAIMRDLTYDDGLTVERRRTEPHHKLGAKIAGRAAEALEAEIRELLSRQKMLMTEAAACRRMAEALRPLEAAQADGQAGLVALVDEHGKWCERLDELGRQRKAIEEDVDPGLTRRKQEIELEIRARREQGEADRNALVNASDGHGKADGILSGGEKIEGSVWFRQGAWRRYLHCKPLYDAGQAKAAYRDRLTKRKTAKAVEKDARERADEAKAQIEAVAGRVLDGLTGYARRWNEASEFNSQTPIQQTIAPWLLGRIDHLENNALIEQAEKAERAATEARNLFQSAFVTELQSRFDGVRSAVDRLNDILDPHRFHYEKYRFRQRRNPIYEPLIELVDAARTDESVLVPLFGETVPEDHPHREALRKVKELLLDEKADFTEFEDYRRYFTFELRMIDERAGTETDLEHRSGVGSGAEKQVPFYVAIGAALAAAYHGQRAKDPSGARGLGLALFDEAFSKMDGKNQKAMLDFYKRLGLQSIIAAPYDKRAAFLEIMDSLVEVTRDDRHVEIDTIHIKEKTRAAVRSENPANLSIDRIRALLSARDAAAVAD